MNNMRILLIDDDEKVRNLMYASLKIWYPDCVITQGSDGEDLVAHAEEAHQKNTPYDLYFTDHNMVRLTGLEALMQIREKGDQTPAIIYTGNVDEVTPYLPRLRQTYCVLKPCELKKLRKITEEALMLSCQTAEKSS